MAWKKYGGKRKWKLKILKTEIDGLRKTERQRKREKEMDKKGKMIERKGEWNRCESKKEFERERVESGHVDVDVETVWT